MSLPLPADSQPHADAPGMPLPAGAEGPGVGGAAVVDAIARAEEHLGMLRRLAGEVEHARAEVEARERALAARQREMREAGESLAALRRSLEAEQEAVRRRGIELDEAARRLEEHRAQIEASSRDAAIAIDARRDEIERASKALAGERAALESLQAELEAREHELTSTGRSVASLEARVAELAVSLGAATARGDAEAQRAQKLAGEVEELTARVAGLEEELRRARQDAEARQQRAEHDLDALAQSLTVSLQRQEALTRQVEQRTRELEELRAASGRAAADAGALAHTADALREELGALKGELEAQRERAAASVRSLEEATQTIARLSAQVEEAAALERELQARQGTIQELREHLERSAQAERAARQDQAEVLDQLERAERNSESVHAELVSTREERDQLRVEVEELRRVAQDPQTKFESARAADAAWGFTLVRRERLRRQKALLRAQSLKIRQAQELLHRRADECEQILALRAEVAAERQAVLAVRRRAEAKMATRSAATVVMATVGTLALLGGLSWGVTQQIVPATYIASAVVAADTRDRPASDAALADWQTYHENLLGDPQMTALAADRLARRGIRTLGTPGALSARLASDLTFASSQPGTLRLELTGQGADRTERILDTLVTAIVSQSNASKDRRADGTPTIVAQPARSGQEPVEDPRPLVAGGMLAGSSLLAFLAALGIRRSILRSRIALDADMARLAAAEEAAGREPA